MLEHIAKKSILNLLKHRRHKTLHRFILDYQPETPLFFVTFQVILCKKCFLCRSGLAFHCVSDRISLSSTFIPIYPSILLTKILLNVYLDIRDV